MPTGRSLDHYAPHSRCFSIFLFLFLSISPVPLTIPVPYKGTQFRRHGIVSASFETTLCPVYRAYSYAVHRCIRRYSVAIPPSYCSFSPIPRTSPSSSLLYFRYSHRSALNFLYNAGYRTRVVDAPTLDCRCGTTRPLRMQRMPCAAYVPARMLCVLFAWERNRRPLIRWRIQRNPRCLDRGGSIRISVWIGRIGMLMHYPCRRWSKGIDFFCRSNKRFVTIRVIIFTSRLASVLTWS